MTVLNGLLLALTVVLVIVGGLLGVVLWQVSVLIASLRGTMLPQIQSILTEVQRSLVHVESITQDVDEKLAKLDSTVIDAQVTVHAVAETTRFLTDGVARPAIVYLASMVTGAGAAWRKYREIRKNKPQARLEAAREAAAVRLAAEAKG